LLCFAVREEARHLPHSRDLQYEILVTGIGPRNAEQAFLGWLGSANPTPLRLPLVLTCGYAGGLDPALQVGQVVFDADPETRLTAELTRLGARAAKFHCSPSIAVTGNCKRRLRQESGADAVEMESGVIRNLCRERRIPAATVRVISDPADTDLPLDFNKLARPDGNISYPRLACALMRSPMTVRELLKFRRDLNRAGRRLGETLAALLRERRC
jgi:hypothetical protein